MKKNSRRLSKTKRLVILSAISAFSKKFDNIHDGSMFSLSSEKHAASKIEVKNALTATHMFFSKIPELDITGTDSTVVNFCIGASNLLVENSVGNVKLRGYNQILVESRKCLIDIDKDEVDDSQKLISNLM